LDFGDYVQIITAVGVIAALVNYVITSRRAGQNDQLLLETRQAQLYMQIYNRWNSKELIHAYGQVRFTYQWTDFSDMWKKYNPEVNPEAYANFMLLMTFFEGLGVLVMKGLVDVALVEDLLSERVIWYWENVAKGSRDDARKFVKDPTQGDHIEYLYHEMMHRQRLTARP
jgi:hypothetical protein